ncbi:MAG: HPF/RaiA family ribosome-associated protein [bacterium]|nr:HPF/RaiA family ribosome-associated protein [bacterium]
MIKKTVKATGLSLDPSIDEAIDKVVAAIEKFTDPADESVLVDIEVGRTTNHHRSGDIFRAEINLHSKVGNLRAEAEKEDLFVALIAAKDELVESLCSTKSKKLDFVRRNGLRLKQMLKGLPWMGGK